ncbi:MAG: hypothetical protein US42_C0010G0021 [Candidatus Magasanikbacteria bacterium GW2011_GWC2_37_14]|uniref:Uncharacterized protein n=1 Tax=Candidatus Magasanikbacteria bacterium GW2011_GWC2_37_14 TaxID=1619046 RepID=A0A0G0IT80_9BACT|nr:MAG: hypothetical protein US42_C0010G0021 [Candidatus Magasanikbacteria bacterium GW2011_GWC2_37_14]
MDKKSKVFFLVFFSLIFFAIAFSFYNYYLIKNYYITIESECNPKNESCFIFICDPVEDSECPENEEERASYYKLIKEKASMVPLCDTASELCPPVICEKGEDCEEIFCDESSLADGEECSSFK